MNLKENKHLLVWQLATVPFGFGLAFLNLTHYPVFGIQQFLLDWLMISTIAFGAVTSGVCLGLFHVSKWEKAGS